VHDVSTMSVQVNAFLSHLRADENPTFNSVVLLSDQALESVLVWV
jgi:hypothetical protein